MTFDVPVTGLTKVTWLFLPDLIERPEARIVNIASASGLIALPCRSSYGASKWGGSGLSEALRQELHDQGHDHVRISTVCPSFIDTGMLDGVTPPRMTKMLDPQKLVDKIVVATRRGDTWLLEPLLVKRTPPFRLLPTRVLDLLAHLCRVAKSMKTRQGH